MREGRELIREPSSFVIKHNNIMENFPVRLENFPFTSGSGLGS